MGVPRRSTGGLAVIVRLATEYGVSADRCLAGTALREADLTDPELEIEPGQEVTAAANLLDACDEPGLGLITGSRMRSTTYGVRGLGMMSCPTGREAARFWLRHADHTRAVTKAWMETDEMEYRVLFETGELPAKVQTFFLEREMASVMTLHQEMFFTDVTPRRLHFTYPQPGHAERYRAYFGIDPVFSAQRNLIALDTAFLDRPLPMADQQIMRRSEQALRESANRSESVTGHSLATRIRSMLAHDPALGIDDIAARLTVSPRTLRRRLVAEGIGYRELQAGVRADLAERLLADGLPTQDVAWQLGYTEPAAFIRAFRRWKGVPPGHYRPSTR